MNVHYKKSCVVDVYLHAQGTS